MTRDLRGCLVCGNQANIESATFDGVMLTCPRCGHFGVAGSIVSRLEALNGRQRALVSGWLREQNELGGIPIIRVPEFDRLLASRFPPMNDRINRVLTYISRRQERLDEACNVGDPALLAIAYVDDTRELVPLFKHLLDRGLMDDKNRLTTTGFAHADEVAARYQASSQGFIAMWFHESMTEPYNAGFYVAIAAAGYKPMRLDKHEHANRIDDEILAQIRRSRFLVADFTNHRGGVYFEAGFALGLNLPVIWTCRSDDMNKLHFDIRQFNCLDWQATDLPSLARRLQLRIEAVIGRGPE